MSARHPRSAPGGPARELLSFRVGAQEFCIDIMAVREIRAGHRLQDYPEVWGIRTE